MFFLYFKFLERDGNRGPWPASIILIGLDWIGLDWIDGDEKSETPVFMAVCKMLIMIYGKSTTTYVCLSWH